MQHRTGHRPAPITAFRVEQAKELLSDLRGIDWPTTSDRDMAYLLGRAEVAIKSLLEVIDEASK